MYIYKKTKIKLVLKVKIHLTDNKALAGFDLVTICSLKIDQILWMATGFHYAVTGDISKDKFGDE